MNVAELASRSVFTVRAEQPLAQAAQMMLEQHVGALVVIEDRAGASFPVGVITDRDIVCGQFTHRADLHCLTIGEVMSSPAVCVGERQDVAEAISMLRARSVRRAPVINAAGEVTGFIALDDLLPAIAGELSTLAELMDSQRLPQARY